jgi:hypothetical protein
LPLVLVPALGSIAFSGGRTAFQIRQPAFQPAHFTPNINAAGPGADKKKNTIDAANLPAE